ncbi:flagellar rod assembly protein/muramidase FlgJ [Hahella sp. CCB-MM4]|uniref:flagellar assembly peptidoglycan hydrolase FlgJ n=1 Tax=Hahella sp. (strain CCB-MM4) TaxID=1926491 RepID=UPI000B9C445B|nr:flagellar assembly peptidoglycan hydrolase FlgJ [Hahella sp. CCB-MM4]OZG73853.1 flagellar rod assembly protein/muramidase FlgJ [Hahella sp. CCB-MM4]
MKTSTPLDQAHVYTDLTALQKLKGPGIDRSQAIEGVARQFESMMVNLMLKSMRQANSVFAEGNMFHEPATEVYQDMLDHQLSLTMTRDKGMGLADMLVKQLTRRESGESVPALYKSLADYPRSQAVMPKLLPSVDQGEESSELGSLTEEEVETLEQVAYYAEQLGGSNEVAEAASDNVSDEGGLVSPQSEGFESPQDFIATLMPIAQKVAKEMGVDPRVLLAQSALETGWGQHMIQDGEQASFNLFGIKADQRWDGNVVWTNTTEYRDGVAMKERAGFRAYNSYEESFTDYLRFLKGNPRYEEALKLAESPEMYTEALQKAGYATDPQYADKINRIIRSGWFETVKPVKQSESASGKGLPAVDIEALIKDVSGASEQI